MDGWVDVDRQIILKIQFYRASAVAASPVIATIGMSVRLSVCHTLALCENEAD